MRPFIYILIFLAACLNAMAQELVVNGGAEQPISVGWTQANPAEAWYPANASIGGVAPHGGTFHFMAGNNSSAGGAAITELYQDISLSSNSTAIDAGTASYTFSGWRRGYPGGDLDQSQIIIEYRDASGVVLNSLTFPFADYNAWTISTNTQNAPIGTRSFRIRLISKRNSGADNDGYYDDISFVYNAPACTPPTSVQLIPNTTTTDCVGNSLFIAGVATPTNANYYYTWYHNGSPITTASKTYTNISKAATTAADAGTYTLRVEDGNAGSAACYKESTVTIILDPPNIAGTISSNQSICTSTAPTPLTGTAATGGVATKFYKWQQSTTSASGPWTTVQAYTIGATGYTPGTLSATTYFRRIDSSGTCVGVATNSITITIDPLNIAGTISSNQRICTGSPTTPLTGTAATGGVATKFYKWQQSTTSAAGPWTTVQAYTIGATGYTPGTLSTTTYFRRIDSSGTCAGVPTNTITITIDALVGAGTISSSQEVCYNSAVTPLTGTAATGGTASKYYKWQSSPGSAAGPWADLQTFSTTATGYAPGIATGFTRYYRRIDSSGTCPNVITNTVAIQTNNRFIFDPITSVLRDTLCIGENFQLIPHASMFAFPFNGDFYFTWKKVQGATTTIVAPASSSMSSYPALSKAATLADSGTYYLIAQDGPTSTQCKDSVKIVIRINQAPTQKALIQSDQEFCLGATAAQLTQRSAATGAYLNGSSYTYQWYTTTDTTGTPALSKIPAATGTTYNPGAPITTTYYVRTDSVKYCAATKTNFLKIRVNNKPILDSIRPTVNDTLCTNLGDQFQLKGYIDSITAGKQSINGGFYFTWKRLREPETIATIVSATAKYTDYPATSRTVVEGDSGTYYLIVQDGINAKKCLDSIEFKIVVYNNCTAVTCSKPNFVSIKLASSINDTLCAGSMLALQKDVLTLPSTPPSFGYIYSWVRTNTLGTIVVQSSTVYQDLIVNSVSAIDSGRYQLIVKDGATTPSVCSESSQPISIKVQEPITQAFIGPSDTTVCSGDPTAVLLETRANTGGTGVYTHQWEFSTDEGLNFTQIPGATTINYQAPSITGKTFLRRIDKSGVCPASTSGVVIVYVATPVWPGSIIRSDTIVCPNVTISVPMTGFLSPSGGSGSAPISYLWQKSTDYNTWINIPNTNSSDYTETNPLNVTTYYRRCAIMGIGYCDTGCTIPVIVQVPPDLNVGSIGTDQSVCSNSSVEITEVTTATGYNVHYQWIQSSDLGITWTSATGNITSYNYNTPVLSDTIWYKRVAITACEQDSSNIVKINVIQTPIVSAGNDTTVTKNTLVTLKGTVTGSTNYSWTPSTGLSNPNILNPNATIINNITYTLTASDPAGLCPAQSSVNIWVKSPLVISNVITANGDGANDTWIIENIEDYPNATFVIYNRWGNIVWKATGNTVQWDGTNYRNGELLADGTYFYIIDLHSTAYSEPLTGYIQLIK